MMCVWASTRPGTMKPPSTRVSAPGIGAASRPATTEDLLAALRAEAAPEHHAAYLWVVVRHENHDG